MCLVKKAKQAKDGERSAECREYNKTSTTRVFEMCVF